MSEYSTSELFFAVLPQIIMGQLNYGTTQQVLTLLPDRKFATEFFADEVDEYINLFQNRTKYLIGGHVSGYKCSKERTTDGRFYVRVTQDVR